MKKVNFGANFTVFLLFFGIALLEAVQKGDLVTSVFWLVAGWLFLRADNFRKEN